MDTILHPAVTQDGIQVHWIADEDGEKSICGATAPYAPLRKGMRATCKSCIRREAGLVARGARFADEVGYPLP
jgi:hypothetical protein